MIGKYNIREDVGELLLATRHIQKGAWYKSGVMVILLLLKGPKSYMSVSVTGTFLMHKREVVL
jgi:hypothetical protein